MQSCTLKIAVGIGFPSPAHGSPETPVLVQAETPAGVDPAVDAQAGDHRLRRLIEDPRLETVLFAHFPRREPFDHEARKVVGPGLSLVLRPRPPVSDAPFPPE